MRIVRNFGIAVALLAGSAAAQPQVVLHAQCPRLEVWAEPLGMALSAGASRGDDEAALLYAPVGVTWRASPGARPWTVELAPYRVRQNDIQGANWGARFGACPVYGAGPGASGPFVQQLGTLMLQRNFTGNVGVGVDVGYRFQLGRLSLTPLMGLGLGVATSRS